MRLRAGVVLVPGVIPDLGWVITEEPFGGTPRAAGVFPFRLGRKPGLHIGDLTKPDAKLPGIRFRNIVDRTIRPLGGPARVRSHGRLKLGLRHFVFTEVKSLGEFHSMFGQFHTGETALLFVLTAHHKLARFHVDKFHGHPLTEIKLELHRRRLARGRSDGRTQAPVFVPAIPRAEHAAAGSARIRRSFPGAATHNREPFRRETRQENLHTAAEAFHGQNLPRVAGGLSVSRAGNRDDPVFAVSDLLVLRINRRSDHLLRDGGFVGFAEFRPQGVEGSCLQLGDDFALSPECHAVPKLGLQLHLTVKPQRRIVISMNPFLTKHIADPLSPLNHQKCFLIIARLGAGEKIHVLVVARRGPARSPAGSEVHAPAAGRPTGERAMATARPRRGRYTK